MRQDAHVCNGWRRDALILIGVLAILFSATGKLNAQALASITGTVTDSSGVFLPDRAAASANANVTVTNDATNVKKTKVTSSAGSYTVTDLLPGI